MLTCIFQCWFCWRYRELAFYWWLYSVPRNRCNIPVIKKAKHSSASLMESKYIALSEVGHKTMWIQYFLEELGFTSQEPTTIFEDNQGTIAFATNEKMHCHMKHIHNKFHFIKKLIEDKIVHLEYGPTSQMTADIFTKILSPTIYECHTKFLQLAPSMLEGECTNMSTKGSNSTSISA